jgi:type I restriction enzyme R subunit
LERINQLLKAKYYNDEKYSRLHKRLMEKDPLTDSEAKLFEALSALKKSVDEEILQNSNMLDNESFVEKMMLKMVVNTLHKQFNLGLNPDKVKRINTMLVKEYMNEYHGRVA